MIVMRLGPWGGGRIGIGRGCLVLVGRWVSCWIGGCWIGGGEGRRSLRCKRSWRASITGEGTSSATALAWIASMCGWR